jgi:hypothetical protein
MLRGTRRRGPGSRRGGCIAGRLRGLGRRHALLREGAASASARVLKAKVLAELRWRGVKGVRWAGG